MVSRGGCLVVVRGLLIAVASLAAGHRLQNTGFSSCGSVAYGIVPGQGSNSYLLHWQEDSLSLSYQGSPGSSIFIILKNLYIVSIVTLPNLQSHQYCKSVFITPRPHQHLLFLVFLMIVIRRSVRWRLIVISICISLMIGYVKHLFMCLMVICMFALEKHLIRAFEHFLILIFFDIELYELFVYFGY